MGARRFRVADAQVAASLKAAGATLVERTPEVEIAPAAALGGDAQWAIVPLHSVRPSAAPRLLRGLQRLARASTIRIDAAAARRTLVRQGYTTQRVLAWELGDWFAARDVTGHTARPLAHRFPLNAVILGSRGNSPETIFDAALAHARASVPSSMTTEAVVVRLSGILIARLGSTILRLAIGPASRLLTAQRSALEGLSAANPGPLVVARLPLVLASGQAGLGTWSLERRLPGAPPRTPLSRRLVDDCLSFLIALHGAGRGMGTPVHLSSSAELAARVCRPEQASALMTAAHRLDQELADIPRGYAHGDFWAGNLLAERERLSGVVDWMAAGPGRLPLLDLLELRVNAVRDRSRLSLGPAVLRYAANDPLRDDAIRAYCERIGLAAGERRVRQLLTAYWLEALARSAIANGADPRQSRGTTWQQENIDLILGLISDNGSLAPN